jgi:multiple sugar transport system ATP-binding protein
MPAVRLQDVSKSYAHGTRAIDRVSLEIADGELLVLVGPSGCGKSTLLRMIAGLEEIREGKISIGSRVVNDVPPKDRDIAMVFQNYALYPHMTVRENMSFGLRRRKLPEAEVTRRVGEAAATLGLERYLDRRPRQLSGGERQRVALGRAIVREPQVFLFDEPLSNLDAQLRVQMRAEIKRIHQRTRGTMIYVTHDQVEAMTLGDRIAVLRAGVLQQVADPFTLYERPANSFVASFIGSPPINLFPAVVRSLQGTATVLEIPGVQLPLSPALERRVRDRVGRTVLVGIRPEELRLMPVGEGATLPGKVEVREPLGNEVLVHWSTPAGTVISRVPGQRAPLVGEQLPLHFAFTRLHLFDPDTEAALDGAEGADGARATRAPESML